MRLTPIKPKGIVRVLEKDGFSIRKQTGSHVILFKKGIRRPISVAMHPRDLPSGTQRAILRQAEISLKEFNKLRKR
jgi:predicted RNA binding protein YcfA (HicA-like mRNA interferase family)